MGPLPAARTRDDAKRAMHVAPLHDRHERPRLPLFQFVIEDRFLETVFFLVVANRITRIINFFFQAEDGIRDVAVTGVQTCALPISELAKLLVAAENPVILGGAAIRTAEGMRSEERRVGKAYRNGSAPRRANEGRCKTCNACCTPA